MSILIDKNTRLVVSGITGREGSFHTAQMMEYGTNVVAGVTPGKGGQVFEADGQEVPVFDTIAEAVDETGANTSMIIVPARFAVDAIYEAADAGVDLIVCLTEYIPVMDMIGARAYLDAKGIRLLGPNCPGLLTPGQSKVGFIPGSIAMPGPVGVVSKSGTLTYEVIDALTRLGIGQTTCVGIGGDPINGTDFIDVLKLFEADPDTKHIVMIGEIGGNLEEQAAAFIKEHVSKPVTSFIAGRTAPPGRRMGHAGAIIEGKSGTAEGKIAALRDAGIPVADNPDDIARIVAERMGM
ncbi:MAG: succinate--CoA ligase subunit alpha [Ardenticatenaceae bacterium]|nr:succinate--CoA ligase subunit alpha [Ardenticatenaceae bacterium]MCB9003302.1 succinate--CoA ligase subunit alpha [Ardenticatenaceae bacterium]